MSAVPCRQVRAVYDDESIRVYQAFNHEIADSALRHGTFVSPPFKASRMTWIKPSFLWMMYRSGWGMKDEGQRRILAIDITRRGFEWALAHSCLSHPDDGAEQDKDAWSAKLAASPVRIQWDPERDLRLQPLEHRSIQIGLGPEAVALYVNEWIVRIADVTASAHAIRALVERGLTEEAKAALPVERGYELGSEIASVAGGLSEFSCSRR
jgi:hypothetical protein